MPNIPLSRGFHPGNTYIENKDWNVAMESLQEAAKLPANSTEPKLFQNKLAYTEDNDTRAKHTESECPHTCYRCAINYVCSCHKTIFRAPQASPFHEVTPKTMTCTKHIHILARH